MKKKGHLRKVSLRHSVTTSFVAVGLLLLPAVAVAEIARLTHRLPSHRLAEPVDLGLAELLLAEEKLYKKLRVKNKYVYTPIKQGD